MAAPSPNEPPKGMNTHPGAKKSAPYGQINDYKRRPGSSNGSSASGPSNPPYKRVSVSGSLYPRPGPKVYYENKRSFSAGRSGLKPYYDERKSEKYTPGEKYGTSEKYGEKYSSTDKPPLYVYTGGKPVSGARSLVEKSEVKTPRSGSYQGQRYNWKYGKSGPSSAYESNEYYQKSHKPSRFYGRQDLFQNSKYHYNSGYSKSKHYGYDEERDERDQRRDDKRGFNRGESSSSREPFRDNLSKNDSREGSRDTNTYSESSRVREGSEEIKGVSERAKEASGEDSDSYVPEEPVASDVEMSVEPSKDSETVSEQSVAPEPLKEKEPEAAANKLESPTKPGNSLISGLKSSVEVETPPPSLIATSLDPIFHSREPPASSLASQGKAGTVMLKEDLASPNKTHSALDSDIEVHFDLDDEVAPSRPETPVNAPKSERKRTKSVPVPKQPLKRHRAIYVNLGEGCVFPLNRKEQALFDLKNRPRSEIIEHQRYLTEEHVTDFTTYPFYKQNILVNEQMKKPRLVMMFQKTRKEERKKQLLLRKQYNELFELWEKKNEQNEAQLIRIYPDFQAQLFDNEHRNEPEEKTPTSRRSRHHIADGVASEAEFEKILQQIKMSDPLYRAEQHAAQIPAMILDVLEKDVIRFVDVNNLLDDKMEFTSRLLTDHLDNFTKAEHAAFCEAFVATPKKFGRISAAMGGLRSPAECVMHYYNTKGTTNYKQLLANKRGRKGARKKTGRKKKEEEEKKDEKTEQSPEEKEESKEVERMVERTVDSSFEKVQKVIERKPEKGTENNEKGEKRSAETSEPKQRKRRALVSEDESKATLIVSSAKADEQPRTELKKSITPQPEPTEEQNLEVKTNSKSVEASEVPRKPNLSSFILPKSVPIDKFSEPVSLDKSEKPEKAPEKPRERRNKPVLSYWSVAEIGMFPALLQKHGTQWDAIAKEMGTKTTIMVRNYYSKNADREGWRDAAEQVDRDREEKEKLSIKKVAMNYSGALLQARQAAEPPVGSFTLTPVLKDEKPGAPIGTFYLDGKSSLKSMTGESNYRFSGTATSTNNTSSTQATQTPLPSLNSSNFKPYGYSGSHSPRVSISSIMNNSSKQTLSPKTQIANLIQPGSPQKLPPPKLSIFSLLNSNTEATTSATPVASAAPSVSAPPAITTASESQATPMSRSTTPVGLPFASSLSRLSDNRFSESRYPAPALESSRSLLLLASAGSRSILNLAQSSFKEDRTLPPLGNYWGRTLPVPGKDGERENRTKASGFTVLLAAAEEQERQKKEE